MNIRYPIYEGVYRILTFVILFILLTVYMLFVFQSLENMIYFSFSAILFTR